MHLAYQYAVRNELKKKFTREMKRLEGSGWKISYVVIKKFQLKRLKVFTLKSEGFHSWISSSVSFLIYKTAMYTIQHNSARPYNCDETSITIVQAKHTRLLGLKCKHQISSVQSAERGSLVTVVSCMSPTGHFTFLRYCYFQEKIWNKNWWMAHSLVQFKRAIPRGGHRARFSPSDLFLS